MHAMIFFKFPQQRGGYASSSFNTTEFKVGEETTDKEGTCQAGLQDTRFGSRATGAVTKQDGWDGGGWKKDATENLCLVRWVGFRG